MIILALDAATQTTGFSVFKNKQLTKYGEIKSSGSLTEKRIFDMIEKIKKTIDLEQPDLIVIEDIQQQGAQGFQTFKILAQLQGALIYIFEQLHKKYVFTYASTWRHYCNIGGRDRKSQKANAQALVNKKFGINCSEDTADGICLGLYAINNY